METVPSLLVFFLFTNDQTEAVNVIIFTYNLDFPYKIIGKARQL